MGKKKSGERERKKKMKTKKKSDTHGKKKSTDWVVDWIKIAQGGTASTPEEGSREKAEEILI